ncbi:MAG: prepilin-type N-terminal cleavage/methylation domain-containing protein [Verrucomicrobiales bacterium]
MKRQLSSRRRVHAFSLIELMVVIGIMVVLAGLLISALPGIQSRVNRQKVEALLAEIEGGLSKYEVDHGIYPQNRMESGNRDGVGVEGASVLYKHLSGDYDEDGAVDFEQNEKVYIPKLAYEENEDARAPRSLFIGGEYMVIDSYGDPLRYIADPPNIPQDERQTMNPTYDLWSIAGADPTDPEEQAKHITNWQAN